MNSPELAAPVPWWKVASVGRNPRVTLIRLSVLILLTFLGFRYVFVPIRVTGISMTPGFKDGERRWVSPLWMRWSGIARGDVVAIQMTGRHGMLLKRVVGLPGERIRITKGNVLIDDEMLVEPYIFNRSASWNWPTNSPERLLGPGEYFVVGDNRAMPLENHYHGIAERHRILGKIIR